jgi:hypothetical protein
VTFTDDGSVYSIQDMFSERTLVFLAEDFTELMPLTLSSLYQPHCKSLRTASHTRVLSPHEIQPASRVCPAVHPGKRPLPALRRLGPFGKAMPGSSAEADGLGGYQAEITDYREEGEDLSLGARVLSWVYFGDRYGIHRKATGRGNGGKKEDTHNVEDDLFEARRPFLAPPSLAGITLPAITRAGNPGRNIPQ